MSTYGGTLLEAAGITILLSLTSFPLAVLIGLFVALLFLFVRFLPMISIFEMRTLVPGSKIKGSGH